MENIGKKIKELRRSKNMTLKEVSEKTDLSISFLSQVETSKCSITLESLRKVSEALVTSPSYFFSEEKNDSLHDDIVINNSTAGIADESVVNFSYTNLSRNFSNPLFSPEMVVLQPRNKGVKPHPHQGEEFILVLEGVLTIVLEDSEISLSEGESLYMKSTTPHNWLNYTEKPIKFLYVSALPK